jgi:hypothetical protein
VPRALPGRQLHELRISLADLLEMKAPSGGKGQKVGDLGNSVVVTQYKPFDVLINVVLREGYDKIRVQSLPTRAPEVWRGLGCWHSSDLWSLGRSSSLQ